MKNLFSHTDYKFEDYGTVCAMTQIDIMRPNGSSPIRWTYELIFQTIHSKDGVDGKGNRASGSARACVIDGTKPREFRMVEIGEEIHTPFGDYKIEWHKEFDWSQPNYDHLRLIEIS